MNKTMMMAAATAAAMAAGTAAAQPQGWYSGVEVGFAFAEDLDTDARDNDVRRTGCDQHFGAGTIIYQENATAAVQTLAVPLLLSDPQCQRGDYWNNSFDLGTGVLAGINIGYAMGPLRFEAEYFHRRHSGERSSLGFPNPKVDELVDLTESISDFRADHLFGNVYYDFHNAHSKITPYVGAGLGWMRVKMDYTGQFLRNADRNVFTGSPSEPTRNLTNPNAAGSRTHADQELQDTLFGYQLLAGVDYPLDERLIIGLKARYADFGGDFKDGSTWDELRSHESTIAPGGNPEHIVEYEIKTDDLSFWGVSLNLKYFF